MSIFIQMIGTGNAFAKRFFNNNALVMANGRKLLIDCGVTATYALHQLSIALTELDGILITHIHGDHIGGLEEVAYRMKFVHRRKLKLFVPDDIRAPLWEHSLKGSMEDRSGGGLSLSDYYDVVSLYPNQPAELFEGLAVTLIPTRHVPGKPSYAVLLNDCVFYSSDMTFDPELLTRLVEEGKCRHILHECQLRGPGIVHTSLEELLTLPESLQQKIWLMHYEDERDEYIGRIGKMRFIEQHAVYRFE